MIGPSFDLDSTFLLQTVSNTMIRQNDPPTSWLFLG